MDFRLTAEEEKFREEVVDFLKKEVSHELVKEVESGQGLGPHSRAFVRKLGQRRWLAPTLPQEYGGMGASYMHRYIVADETFYCLPDLCTFTGAQIVAPILMEVATEEQKNKYLPPIARGEIEFALGYTEADAGSDLANINIRAVEQDDHFIINGTKLYNTACHYSQYHWLCARTAVTEPKHKGLSLFIVPLDSPGITLSGMYTMAGERTNEVSYDNVIVPRANLVGEKNRGFYHMAVALEHERIFPVGKLRRTLDDITTYVKKTKRDGKPLADDTLTRQKLAELATDVEAATCLGYRVVWLVANHKPSDWEAATLKLFVTGLEQKISLAALRIMQQQGLVDFRSSYTDPAAGWVELWFRSNARRTISGGSSEIQRNVIAQRGLGLPRN